MAWRHLILALALGPSAWPLAATAQFTQVQKLTASAGGQGDQLGLSVAIDGDTLVVGAPLASDDESEQGLAWVYQRDAAAGSWVLIRQLSASDLGARSQFGASVSISGDIIVVGVPRNDIGFELDQGVVYAFERSAGGANQWGEVQRILSPEPAGFGTDIDLFGASVAVDGNTLVVGAPVAGLTHGDEGAAFVYMRNFGAGQPQWGLARILAGGTEGESEFGAAVAIHGDTVVVGRPGTGSVLVFARDEGGEENWGRIARVAPSVFSSGRTFGRAVGLHGDTLVVGDTFEQGAAYFFERSAGPTGWGEVHRSSFDLAGLEDRFGSAVAVEGDTAVVGASELGAACGGAGRVHVLGRNQGGANSWGEVALLLASDAAPCDAFGAAAALAGGQLVVGAPTDDIGAGANVDRGSAYVFGSFRPPLRDVFVHAADATAQQIAFFGEATGAPGDLSALVNGEARASTNGVTLSNLSVDPSGALSANVSATCDATDASFTLAVFAGGELLAEDVLTFTVGSSAAPVLSLRTPFSLWPPSPLYWPVPAFALVESATDDCDGDLVHEVVIEQLTSDEPDDAPGGLDGRTRHDIVAPFCEVAFLRAERNKAGNGRVYGLTLRVRDSEGNETRAVLPIGVPITRRVPAVADAPAQTVATGCP